MITVEFVQKEILKEILQVYVKTLFVENCFPSLFYYTNGSFGNYSVDYFWNILKPKIRFEDYNKILSISPQEEFEKLAKRAIREILEKVDEDRDKDSTRIIFDSFTVTPCFSSQTMVREYEFRDEKFGFNNDKRFFLEFYLSVPENSMNLGSFELKDVVNPSYFLEFVRTQEERLILTNFQNIKLGLRLCFNPGPTSPVNPGNIAKLKKSFYLLEPLGGVLCPIPVCHSEIPLIFTSKADIELQIGGLNNTSESVQNLKTAILNTDDFRKLFTEIVPIDCLDLVFACQFHRSSDLFREVLRRNNFYLNSSANVMNTIDKLINYRDPI